MDFPKIPDGWTRWYTQEQHEAAIWEDRENERRNAGTRCLDCKKALPPGRTYCNRRCQNNFVFAHERAKTQRQRALKSDYIPKSTFDGMYGYKEKQTE